MGIHADRRAVDKKVKTTGKRVQPCHGETAFAPLVLQDLLQLVAERLRCGQAVFPCGDGDIRFLRGVQGFKGHHTRGAARP